MEIWKQKAVKIEEQFVTQSISKYVNIIYTYFKKRFSGRTEVARPKRTVGTFGMQNFTSCVAHVYACAASENQALQLVYPFSSMGNATSEILHTKWYPQVVSVVQPPFSPTTFFEIGIYS